MTESQTVPDWLRGLSHRDFLLDGYSCPEARWRRLDWSRAWVDMGPSPAGNPGPYWHVPLRAENGSETVHRLYPKVIKTKWVALIRRVVEERERCPELARRAVWLRT